MLFAWHDSDYNRLARSYLAGNFHALLIYGGARSGQNELVNHLLKFILCDNKNELQPCDNCTSCIIFRENNHPDLYTLAADDSEERKTLQIKVEQIRWLNEFASRSTHSSQKKIIYLPRLQELNTNSANALLKVLEEPPQKCIFILQADDIARVLPTIKSRCFKFALSKPQRNEAIQYIADVPHADFWLQYYEGEPLFDILLSEEQLQIFLKVLQTPSVENILVASKELDPKKIGMAVIMEFILKWLNDLMQVVCNVEPNYFKTYADGLTKLIPKVNNEKLYQLQQDVIFLLEWSNHPLNQKLQFENILFKYQQIYV